MKDYDIEVGDEFTKINKVISDHLVNNFQDFAELEEEVNRLDSRIDGLPGGHNHKDWMYKLGLAKRSE